jgi:hypothetical protein
VDHDPSVIGAAPPVSRRPSPLRRILWVAVVVAIVVGIGFAAFRLGSSSGGDTATPSRPATTAVPTVANAPLGALLESVERHDAQSLSLNVYGAMTAAEDRSLRELLDHLGFNTSAVMNRIGNTRALDGTQSAEGRAAKAYWSYHPDAGLNLVIEAAPLRP